MLSEINLSQMDEAKQDNQVISLTVKPYQMIPSLFQYQFLRYLVLENDQIKGMTFLRELPLLENLKIRSQNLTSISDLGNLKYLSELDLENCQIRRIEDYPSYRKMIKLYTLDQEDGDNHHIYYSQLKIQGNPFNYQPTYTIPRPTLQDLAAQALNFNQLAQPVAEMVTRIAKMDFCSLCHKIRPLDDFWIRQALGLMVFYVNTKMCYSCRIQEYHKAQKAKNDHFLVHFTQLIQDLNQIIESEISKDYDL